MKCKRCGSEKIEDANLMINGVGRKIKKCTSCGNIIE